MKTIMTTVLLVLVISLGYAGNTSVQQARQNLNVDLKDVFTEDINRYNNYLYQRGIDKLDEDVQVIFRVNEDQSLGVLRVTCNNPQAIEYVKHVLQSKNIKADDCLVGKAFTVNFDLRYRAY
ncbi:MAG: hypothetical protein AB7U05_06885 [Mangrovibacterium sp.]